MHLFLNLIIQNIAGFVCVWLRCNLVACSVFFYDDASHNCSFIYTQSESLVELRDPDASVR